MGDRWLPYSAAALASGAAALVLGALTLPSSPNGYELLQNAQLHSGRWAMAAAAFFLSAVGLTLGLPTFLHVLPKRGRVTGMAGMAVFELAAMGMAAYAALLIFFQALVRVDVINEPQVDLLADDRGLQVFAVVFVGAFYLGELLLAVALLRARTVRRWLPWLFVAHALLLPLNALEPRLQTLQTVLIGVAFMGVAIEANERSQI